MVERLTIRLPSGEFSYLESGEGNPVVFLHALGRSAADWIQVMEGMENEWRCIALDQRGHGLSVRPGEYRYELFVSDLRSFVDGLGLDRFVLIAHSMGGVVGLVFAEESPDRLEALILEDTGAPMDRHEYPDVPVAPPEPVDYDWEVRRQLFRQLNTPDPAWYSNVSRVTTPTLLIAGTPSDSDLEETERRLPEGSLITIEAGHWIHETEPERYLKAIRRFLQL